jgi:hypothetical protein
LQPRLLSLRGSQPNAAEEAKFSLN